MRCVGVGAPPASWSARGSEGPGSSLQASTKHAGLQGLMQQSPQAKLARRTRDGASAPGGGVSIQVGAPSLGARPSRSHAGKRLPSRRSASRSARSAASAASFFAALRASLSFSPPSAPRGSSGPPTAQAPRGRPQLEGSHATARGRQPPGRQGSGSRSIAYSGWGRCDLIHRGAGLGARRRAAQEGAACVSRRRHGVPGVSGMPRQCMSPPASPQPEACLRSDCNPLHGG